MKTNEFLKEDCHEASMARAELLQIAKNAIALAKLIKEGDDLPGWVSSYITLADDHLNSVHQYMEYNSADADVLTVAEDASCGATSAGAVSTSMGGGNGFANGGPGVITRKQMKKAKKK